MILKTDVMTSKRRKEPVHKIFYVCSTFTPDDAWAEFLKECSFGKFPRGIRFENGAIKCSRKKQIFTEYIPKDAEKALQVILEIFRDRLGIKTSKEKKNAREKFEKKRNQMKITDWKSINKSNMNIRNSLIRNFAERFSDQEYLSESEQKELILLLSLGISSKLIGDDDIVMVDGRIVEITNLKFDVYTRHLSLKGNLTRNPLSENPIPMYLSNNKQENYGVNFGKLLDYHCAKMHATPVNAV